MFLNIWQHYQVMKDCTKVSKKHFWMIQSAKREFFGHFENFNFRTWNIFTLDFQRDSNDFDYPVMHRLQWCQSTQWFQWFQSNHWFDWNYRYHLMNCNHWSWWRHWRSLKIIEIVEIIGLIEIIRQVEMIGIIGNYIGILDWLKYFKWQNWFRLFEWL